MKRLTITIALALLTGLALSGCQDSTTSFSKMSRAEQDKAFAGDKEKALEMQAKYKAQYSGPNSPSQPKNLGQPPAAPAPATK
jgi:hypothetical protein